MILQCIDVVCYRITTKRQIFQYFIFFQKLKMAAILNFAGFMISFHLTVLLINLIIFHHSRLRDNLFPTKKNLDGLTHSPSTPLYRGAPRTPAV